MKTYNKIISVLLCIIMISISIPSFVFASDDNEYNNVSGHVTVDSYLKLTPLVSLLLDGVDGFTNLSSSQREAIRDAFVDYFWECVENE